MSKNNNKINSSNNKDQRTIPLSLGKPSLRRRLEAYYSIVAPQQIANPSEWLVKLDQIYDKYGGTVEGEAKLARQLTRKYGSGVALQIVVSSNSSSLLSSSANTHPSTGPAHDESYYQDAMKQSNGRTGVVDMTSATMDALAVLNAKNQRQVEQENPWLLNPLWPGQEPHQHQQQQQSSPTQEQQQPLAILLERVELFAPYLPRCDPLAAPAAVSRKRKVPTSTSATGLDPNASSKSTLSSYSSAKFNVPRCFAEIAQAVTSSSNYNCYTIKTKKKQKKVTPPTPPPTPPPLPRSNAEENRHGTNDKHETVHEDHEAADDGATSDADPTDGPMGLLWRAMYERFAVRVLIRYGKRGLRGTVTGLVVAMDKHWNLILQDAQEVYSPTAAATTTKMPGQGRVLSVSNTTTTTTKDTARPNRERIQQYPNNDSNNNDEDDDDDDNYENSTHQVLSPLERELNRRQCDPTVGRHRRRSLPQIMVRGDTIVLVYRATAEQSAHDVGGLQSRYRKRSQPPQPPPPPPPERSHEETTTTITTANTATVAPTPRPPPPILIGTPGTCTCNRAHCSDKSTSRKKRFRRH
ncbi:hypothetical protein ACA910_017089 [Epithemia clementina (nom. ined.)]